MYSYSTSVPLALDSNFGFAQIKDFKTLAKQNLKMLLLTNPGERFMNPDFGVGIKFYLFELTDGVVVYKKDEETFTTQNGLEIETSLQERITKQAARYLPYISSLSVQSQIVDNVLAIKVNYYLPSINSYDEFLYIDANNTIITDGSTLEAQKTATKSGFRNEIIQASDLNL